MFDFPTKDNKKRDILRLKLKEMGFEMTQRSVFVYPYPAKNEIDFLGEYLGIRKHITCILAKEMEGSRNYKKLFKL